MAVAGSRGKRTILFEEIEMWEMWETLRRGDVARWKSFDVGTERFDGGKMQDALLEESRLEPDDTSPQPSPAPCHKLAWEHGEAQVPGYLCT